MWRCLNELAIKNKDLKMFFLLLTSVVPVCCFPPSVLEPHNAGTSGPKPFACLSAAPPAASSTSTLSGTYGGRAAELPAKVGLMLHALFTCKAVQ